MKKSKFHTQFCLALIIVAVLAGFGSLHAAEDGDADDSEAGEVAEASDAEFEVQCLRDEDCETGWICRDIGICVPLDCDKDADCKLSGFYCREDGVCAPEVCVYDRDCPQNEFCDKGSCLTLPGEHGYPYVEGGSPNCSSAGNSADAASFLIVLLVLALLRKRSNVH